MSCIWLSSKSISALPLWQTNRVCGQWMPFRAATKRWLHDCFRHRESPWVAVGKSSSRLLLRDPRMQCLLGVGRPLYCNVLFVGVILWWWERKPRQRGFYLHSSTDSLFVCVLCVLLASKKTSPTSDTESVWVCVVLGGERTERIQDALYTLRFKSTFAIFVTTCNSDSLVHNTIGMKCTQEKSLCSLQLNQWPVLFYFNDSSCSSQHKAQGRSNPISHLLVFISPNPRAQNPLRTTRLRVLIFSLFLTRWALGASTLDYGIRIVIQIVAPISLLFTALWDVPGTEQVERETWLENSNIPPPLIP